MSKSGHKADRRSRRMKDMINEYISMILADHTDELTPQEYSRQNGIIRDRIAFYIAKTYGVNFHMVRFYKSPTNQEVDAVESFVESVDYRDKVRPFYYDNKEEFKALISQERLPRDSGCVILDRNTKQFLRFEDGRITLTTQGLASVVDQFIDRVLTKKVMEMFITEHGEQGTFDILPIKVSDASLYHLAELG